MSEQCMSEQCPHYVRTMSALCPQNIFLVRLYVFREMLCGHSADIYLQGYMSAQYPSSVFSSDGSLKFHRSEIFHQRFLFGSHARFLPFNLIHTLRVQNS